MLNLLINKRTKLPELAKDAMLHKTDGHACPVCECDLYPTTSPLGNTYGRCYPGKPHEEKCSCKSLADSKQYIDIETVDIEIVDNGIMKMPKIETGGGGKNHPGDPHPEKEIISNIKSLKDIFELGLCEMRDFALNSKTNLTDILLNRYNLHTVMRDNVNIGRRAIVAKPDFVIPSVLTIRFCAFTQIKVRGTWAKVQKVFDLKFDDEKSFWKYVDKIFNKSKGSNGAIRYESKYTAVLIYGRWRAVDAEACKKDCRKNCDGVWKCTGYQCAECSVPAHQIYCPTQNKVKI